MSIFLDSPDQLDVTIPFYKELHDPGIYSIDLTSKMIQLIIFHFILPGFYRKVSIYYTIMSVLNLAISNKITEFAI